MIFLVLFEMADAASNPEKKYLMASVPNKRKHKLYSGLKLTETHEI